MALKYRPHFKVLREKWDRKKFEKENRKVGVKCGKNVNDYGGIISQQRNVDNQQQIVPLSLSNLYSPGLTSSKV